MFLVNIETDLLLALVRYILCSHFTQNCILLYFLEARKPYFVTKNCCKSSYICLFILLKKRCNWIHKNPHNSGMVGRRKLPDPSLNSIFNALLIGVPIYALVSVNWFWLEVPSEVGKYLAEVLLLSRLNYCSVAYAQIPMYLTNSFMTEVPHI